MFDIEIVRHSLAHVMAYAVQELYKDVKFGIGPAIENGFYYDFDINKPFEPEDLQKIEDKMRELIKKDVVFERIVLTRDEALKQFADQPYKVELIKELSEGETITAYRCGDFIDLCRGPHVDEFKYLRNVAFKLDKSSTAYWRGSEKNKMLQRIYAFAFLAKDELKAHLNFIAEAKERDHRKLGPQLDLFMLSETAPGMPYWLPKGWKLFNTMIDFWREEHEARGYEEISSPLINSRQLWVTSGHWEHYKEDMFSIDTEEGETPFAVKPMNCPNAMVVYKRKLHSYRDFPLRYSDCDVLHRKEGSGTLHGLLRVQMFRQDDSHNFIRPDQIESEIESIFEIADKFYKIFNLTYRCVLSTRPDDFMGDPALWDEAERVLGNVLEKRFGKDGFQLNEGDGAFYGPKIDLLMKDALGREWQTGTIQLDFQLPRNFDLTYTDKDGSRQTPVVVHRVIYGSFERFIGILIEHTKGEFPLWLSPTQVGIVPVSEEQFDYAKKVADELRKNKIRVELDLHDGGMGAKVNNFRKMKTPYTVIVGNEEIANNSVSIKIRGGKQINNIPLDKFVSVLNKQIEDKTFTIVDEF